MEIPLTAQEELELKALKRAAPYRDWYAIKFPGEKAWFVDSRRKAIYRAKKGGDNGPAPASIYHVE